MTLPLHLTWRDFEFNARVHYSSASALGACDRVGNDNRKSQPRRPRRRPNSGLRHIIVQPEESVQDAW